MQNSFLQSTLVNQERQATKLFLYLFYLIGLLYDIVFRYLYPLIAGDPKGDPSHWPNYVFQLLLLPMAMYYFRKNRPGPIKYIYFISYTVINIIIDIITKVEDVQGFASGNFVELVIVLFSPIFVNWRFFWTVALGTIGKYVLIGLFMQLPGIVAPILLFAGFSVIALIILNRFDHYVKAISLTYQQQLGGIVKGIISTLELKDPYTRGHSDRVAHYSTVLAKRLGKFSEHEMLSFYYSCLLHDVGKVHIPDHILTKPGRLTNEEYEIIKTHTTAGAEAIRSIQGLEDCVDVVLYHHERWDGKGYPHGLKGEEIPLLARIASIADAFDAMTTQRSYRSALPAEEAYRRVLEGAGTQFDPDLIEVFKSAYPKWEEFLNLNQWKEIQQTTPSFEITNRERRRPYENP